MKQHPLPLLALAAALLLLLAGCTGGAASTASSASFSSSAAPAAPVSSAPPSTVAEVPATVTVTIPEGFTFPQIAARLEENGVCSAQAFFEAAQSYSPSSFSVPENENRAYKMEGYLFPDTYEFYTGSDPEDVLVRMLNNYRQKAGDLTDEQLIIASIIERESRSEEAAAMVSSVIYNRLTIDMPLQMDSTREYVNQAVTGSPFLGDTERFAALYNTYKCEALPAGPICCPGAHAMTAAQNPVQSDYLYFFFGNDNQNHYSHTLEEHAAAMEEFGVQYG